MDRSRNRLFPCYMPLEARSLTHGQPRDVHKMNVIKCLIRESRTMDGEQDLWLGSFLCRGEAIAGRCVRGIRPDDILTHS